MKVSDSPVSTPTLSPVRESEELLSKEASVSIEKGHDTSGQVANIHESPVLFGGDILIFFEARSRFEIGSDNEDLMPDSEDDEEATDLKRDILWRKRLT